MATDYEAASENYQLSQAECGSGSHNFFWLKTFHWTFWYQSSRTDTGSLIYVAVYLKSYLMDYIPECDAICVFECIMFYLALLFKGIEGSTAIGVTQVVTTSVGMTDIDIRAVSKNTSTANSVHLNGRTLGFH